MSTAKDLIITSLITLTFISASALILSHSLISQQTVYAVITK